MLTKRNLAVVRPHPMGVGEQRIYRFGTHGLSMVNNPSLHSYEFAWEAAVIEFEDDDEANVFIKRARAYFCPTWWQRPLRYFRR